MWYRKNRRFLSNVSQYLREGTWYVHTYYIRLIGISLWPVEHHQFLCLEWALGTTTQTTLFCKFRFAFFVIGTSEARDFRFDTPGWLLLKIADFSYLTCRYLALPLGAISFEFELKCSRCSGGGKLEYLGLLFITDCLTIDSVVLAGGATLCYKLDKDRVNGRVQNKTALKCPKNHENCSRRFEDVSS